MTVDKWFWFFLLLTGLALMGVAGGWRTICFYVGAGIVGWMLGEMLRKK